jgi:MFS family permease
MPSPSEPTSPARRAAALRFIILLGMVSLFADATYEGARSIHGPFLKNLGASASAVGLVAGLGEFFGFALRLFSGALADRTRAYWTITILGYAMNLFAVPALAFAGNWEMAALLVILERTGKSLRAPARDVLLSEAAHDVGSGWGFGLHAAFDQTGAVIGPLFVAWSVARTGGYGPAMLWLAIPAGVSLLALLVARANSPVSAPELSPVEETKAFPKVFWVYITAAALLAIGYCDFPIIAFHLEKTRLAKPSTIPLLYAFAMAMNGSTALLFGRLYDRLGLTALSLGLLISALALPLEFLGGAGAAIAGVACWGTGMGAMDAILRAGISKVVSMNKRGRAFGVFNAIYGAAWLAGSSAMGLLYEHSILALVALGIVAQGASAVLFFSLRGKLSAK